MKSKMDHLNSPSRVEKLKGENIGRGIIEFRRAGGPGPHMGGKGRPAHPGSTGRLRLAVEPRSSAFDQRGPSFEGQGGPGDGQGGGGRVHPPPSSPRASPPTQKRANLELLEDGSRLLPSESIP